MTVYLSGAITGNADWREEFNNAEEKLKVKGYVVFNPATIGERLEQRLGRTPTYHEYMREDIAMLIISDRIYMVNDWAMSHGADVERRVAVACGIPELTKKEIQEK